MSDIDVSKIKSGDRVRVSMKTPGMEEHRVPPVEFDTVTYPWHGGRPAVLGVWVGDDRITILEHTPTTSPKPEWADALVVKVSKFKDNEFGSPYLTLFPGDGEFVSALGEFYSWKELEEYGPVTIIVDKDGKISTQKPEIEWLDPDELEKLPIGAAVLRYIDNRVFTLDYRNIDSNEARWGISGSTSKFTSQMVDPARVIYLPEDS